MEYGESRHPGRYWIPHHVWDDKGLPV